MEPPGTGAGLILAGGAADGQARYVLFLRSGLARSVAMRVITVVLSILLIAAPAGAQQQTGYVSLPSVTLPAELDRILRDYERAWRAGDEAALAALFTPDGFVPTLDGWVRGSEAIRRTYAEGAGPLRLRALAFATADTVGYIVGAYGYGDPDGGDTGKFLLALRRGPEGRWLIAADLDNSNRR
jgi:ketosteroid isomerase-like protein